MSSELGGVYAAALTPLSSDYTADLEAIPKLMAFYAERGCHGALLLGTTGEGPSFSPKERLAIFKTGLAVREKHPDFRLFAGTGTPSMDETASITRGVFDLGYNGVVVLPPYYFRDASEEGLFNWFSWVIQKAVPADGAFLGYHFPGASGVPLTLDLLSRLKDAFPRQFVGIKDSSGDPQHAVQLGQRFGNALTVLTGNDSLFSLALENQASGCIAAMANLCSPGLRTLWDAYQRGEKSLQLQRQLDARRTVLAKFQPYAPTLKAMIAQLHGFPHWPVRPPLMPLSPQRAHEALTAFAATGYHA